MKPIKSTTIIFTMVFFCIHTDNFALPPRIRSEKCSIIFSPESPWKELGLKKEPFEKTNGKPTLVAQITFKKRLKDPVNLNSLKLRWHGPIIDHIFGSLYKKDPEKEFLPLQHNLVCDGVWNKAEQSLILNFDMKQKLSATNIFCLVFDISPEIQDLLKQGNFTLYEDTLPDVFKSCARSQTLILRC